MELGVDRILISMILKNKSLSRKIYYALGLISLIFLPIAFYTNLPTIKRFTVINYVVPKDKVQPGVLSFNGEYLMKEIKKKKIISFYLDEDYELNKCKLNVIQLEALKLKFTCDTNHVIAIHYSDSLFFGEFVNILNLMNKYKFKRYAEWKNTFYIFGEYPPEPENEI